MSKEKIICLVPVEPTQEMLKAGQDAWLKDPAKRSSTLYKAMLAAAPEVEHEPAAWRAKSPERIPQFFDSRQAAMTYCGSGEWVIEPVYLHPQPAPAD